MEKFYIFENAAQRECVLLAVVARMNLIEQRRKRSVPNSKADKACEQQYETLKNFKLRIDKEELI